MEGCEHKTLMRQKHVQKAHDFLCAKSKYYHAWHHNKHHTKVHWTGLVVSLVITAGFIANIFGVGIKGALAASTGWSFGSAPDYTLSDSNLAEISGNTVKLKVREYIKDASTKLLMHLNGDATDSSDNANTATVTGGSYGVAKLNNGVGLNGISDYIKVNDSDSLSLNGPQTMEAWAKFNSPFSGSSAGSRQYIADKGNYQLYYDSTTGKINYELEPNTAKTWTKIAGDYANGSWPNYGHDQKEFATSMTKIGDNFYAGVGYYGVGQAEVWKWDGATWSMIGGHGVNYGWADLIYINAIVTSSGNTLYAAVSGAVSGDAEVWSCDVTANPIVWTKIGGDGMGWAGTGYFSIESLTWYGTNLVVGINSNATIYSWDGAAWTKIAGGGTNSSWSAAGLTHVWSLTSDGTNLYAGLGGASNAPGTGQIWKFNGTTWGGAMLGGDNLGDGVWPATNTYEGAFSLAWDGTNLYAGMGQTAGDGDLYKYNGSAWSKLGGFTGDSKWDNVTGDHEFVYSLAWSTNDSALYIGLGGSNSDAEVWRYMGGNLVKIGGDNILGAAGGTSFLTNASDCYANSIFVDGGTVYAGVTSGAYGGGHPNTPMIWKTTNAALTPGNPDWTMIAGDYVNYSWGFYGLSAIESMASVGGKLYVGTGSSGTAVAADNREGMVWQWDGNTWTIIGGQDLNGSWGKFTKEEVKSMVGYKGELYVGLGNTTKDAEIWKWNGSTWSLIAEDTSEVEPDRPANWTNYESVYSMAVFNGKLYAGLGSTGGDSDVWEYDGSNWAIVAGRNYANQNVNSSWGDTTNYEMVQSLISYKGKLYAGLGNSVAGDAELWEWTAADDWTRVGGDGVGPAGHESWADSTFEEVDSLAVYDDMLYAGLGTTSGDAEVWQFDGTNWAKVGGDDAINSWNGTDFEMVKSMAVYDGYLYASLGNSSNDAKVFRYAGSGTSWTRVGGELSNNSWGSSQESAWALTVHNGTLYAGVGDGDNDARIYSYGSNALLQSTTASFDNNWHHVAATYDGQTMKIYIDGVLDASQAAGITMADGSKNLLIGTGYGSTGAGLSQGHFAGTLDEVRISNVARDSFNTTTYTNAPQTVQPNSVVLANGVKAWSGFTTSETTNGGNITYRLSLDGGETWKYFSGGSWITSDNLSNANSASDVNANISTFPVTTGGIFWQAILTGNGEQLVTLNSVSIEYTADSDPPTNPTSASVDATGVNDWYSQPTPHFTWAASSDANDGDTSNDSGVSRYFVYFGTNPDGDPCGDSHGIGCENFGTEPEYYGTDLTSGETYYLRVETIDSAGNLHQLTDSDDPIFTYKYDGTAPSKPSYVTVSPSGYSATNSFVFLWPASTDEESTIKEYKYQIRKSDNSLSSWVSTGTDRTVTLTDQALEGENTFYLKAINNAGVESPVAQVNFYFNESAPISANADITVTPATNTTNNFAFSWTMPEGSYQGDSSSLTYYYCINCEHVPVLNETTTISAGSSTSLSPGPYATQQSNTFWLFVRDGAGNINWSTHGVKEFTANTTAPGTPLNLSITDASNRANDDFRLALNWSAPTSGVTPSKYKVYRAIGSNLPADFDYLGETTSLGFIDTGLNTDLMYYYKVTALDSVGAESVPSELANKRPTGRYTEPPTVTSAPKVSTGASSVKIEWDTNREAEAIIDCGTTTNYGLNGLSLEPSIHHEVSISGLNPGTAYHYRLQSLDPGELKDYQSSLAYSDDYVFQTDDATKISSINFSDITTSSALLTFETSKNSSSVIEYGTSPDLGSIINDDSTSATKKHIVKFSGLKDGQLYQVKVTITDEDGNSISSSGLSFTTVALPRIEGSTQMEPVADAPTTTYKFAWKTNVETTTVGYYTSSDGKRQSKSSPEMTKEHEVTIGGLLDMQTYTFELTGADQYGNSVTNPYTPSVATPKDSRPPKVSNLTVEVKSSGFGATQKAQVVISWETDELATSQVEYGQGISNTSSDYSNKSKEDAALSNSHVVILSELEPSKIYHLRAISKDSAGNAGASEDTTTITGKMQNSVLDIIVNSLERSLGWVFGIFK